jgi:DNA phosphorothioation-dependent restriction protein DptG
MLRKVNDLKTNEYTLFHLHGYSYMLNFYNFLYVSQAANKLKKYI